MMKNPINLLDSYAIILDAVFMILYDIIFPLKKSKIIINHTDLWSKATLIQKLSCTVIFMTKL